VTRRTDFGFNVPAFVVSISVAVEVVARILSRVEFGPDKKRQKPLLDLWAEDYGCFVGLRVRQIDKDEAVWKHLKADIRRKPATGKDDFNARFGRLCTNRKATPCLSTD
jgi:hypothetical protein